ncbi:hypothetical protein QH494_27525 [Sphingomonas sp. AR_OL41]|nr:hypothetical protein [Sphingomonas sp. AR_OL41]
MDKAAARRIFDSFLEQKEKAIGQPLACFDDNVERIGGGWAFRYQGRAWVETRNMDDLSGFLVGHGPVVVLDTGEVLEGGSLDRDPNEIVRRHSASL